MVRLLKLSILAACLIVPFWGWGEGRLRPGSKAFAVGCYPIGTKLEVLADDDVDPSANRAIAVVLESGEVAQVIRADMHPIDNAIGGGR